LVLSNFFFAISPFLLNFEWLFSLSFYKFI